MGHNPGGIMVLFRKMAVEMQILVTFWVLGHLNNVE